MPSYVLSVMAPNGVRHYFRTNEEARAYATEHPMPTRYLESEESNEDNGVIAYQNHSRWRKQPYVEVNGEFCINDKGKTLVIQIESFVSS